MAESCAGCFRVSILSVFDDCLWQTQAKEKDSMQVKLFVGNLPWSVGDTELEDLFADQGTVQSARVITDRETGRSRGFGFVEIETNDANAVINAVNGREINGRPLRVNRAEEKARAPRRDSYGGGGGGGGRGRY